jgi:polar amino acid transport system substrate-binding protein
LLMRGIIKLLTARAPPLSLCALLFWTFVVQSQVRADAGAGQPQAKIVVGTMRVPPFVLRSDDGQWSGLSIDLWKRIADELKVPFEFREFEYDLAGLLDAVQHGRVDAVIAAIPITQEGEARFDFTHPYFAAGLGIAVRGQPQGGLAGTITGLFTYRFVIAVAALFGLLFFVGVLIWLLERRQKSHFDSRPPQGIADGVWWAAVTMTSTGYGDKVPATLGGRVLAIVWMFASIFLVALFSATLASSFVVGRLKTGISDPDDLARVRVAAVSGTTGEQWLNAQGLNTRTYPFVIQAMKALQRGDVQALVYEKAILGYMIKEYGWNELRVLPHTLAVREYAIALPNDSPIKKSINLALLKVVHGPAWKGILERYLGETEHFAAADWP